MEQHRIDIKRLAAGVFAFALLLSVGTTTVGAETVGERLKESAAVLKEIMDAPDQGIPADLFDKAYCVVVVPGVKNVGLGLGGKYGRGFAICRSDPHAAWGAPAAVRMEGGSVGFQIGVSATDVIMLVMDQRSMDGILASKFTLGAGAEVAAGPVGRNTTAETDASMKAKILSYSRSRGAFAGLALSGATLRQDLDENKAMYGKPLTNTEVLTTKVKAPVEAEDLLALLSKYSRGAA